MSSGKPKKGRCKTVKKLTAKESRRLFLIALSHLKSKGYDIKALPKTYPVSKTTLYRVKNGEATTKTVKKINNLAIV